MASVRKKPSTSSENNLKYLRELVSLPCNKHCFDCNQRGPTYVNVTIGSFVCTKCSGMLRGLTPPQRVKSISMATFTMDEIELLRSRGNDYCRSTWLGLYEKSLTTEIKDEQIIKDFMVDKYERKRYYLDPSMVQRNDKQRTVTTNDARPLSTLIGVGNNKPILSLKIQQNGSSNNKPAYEDHLIMDSNHIKSLFPTVNISKTGATDNGIGGGKLSFTPENPEFVADFGSADIFSSTQSNNNSSTTTQQPSFANFENNPIFNSTTYSSNFPTNFFEIDFGCFNNAPLPPKYNINRWSMPTPTALNNMQNTVNSSSTVSQTPSEDRYAALKDLDMALKQQSQDPVDWYTTSSTGSSYGSPTPTSSIYGSQSPASSVYSSPSQDQFSSVFPKQEQSNQNISNPFSANTWLTNGNVSDNNGLHNNSSSYIFNQNPFRSTDNINGKVNGTLNGYSSSQLSNNINGKAWGSPNPFSVGISSTTAGHPSNPFL